ncbi:hypothetical protein FQN55_009272 [Onygenales sp. PD_40]|nr:hypothetical protein FQN55_009272 [Onygenales sp. PD_40]KAK2777582.1 hypothetical protein FQN53_002200 [Emmonsiellopsis sp. PD_33]KAK2782079.1 hypothetical protein FQN52_001192 [Onygenales sp. PD_12]KAK2798697.1 hypothetical protein FQN51_007559 [Onygenales sp. PD_10]
MSSYFSSLTSSNAISNFSTRFNSLRRAISSSDETDDPDSEDASHISNVLRAYYTEKGRRFPAWLPPDPKSPTPPPPTVAVASQASLQGYGGASAPATLGGGRGGLGDLWGDSAPAAGPPAQATSSLRLNRNITQQPGPTSSSHLMPSPSNIPARPATASSNTRNAGSYFERQNSRTPPPPTDVRPLPSQRAGSYQTSQAAATTQQGRLGRGGGGLERSHPGGSAQERLRARLHGGGSNGGGGNQAPARTANPGYNSTSGRQWESGGGDPYGSSGYGGTPGGGGGGLPGRRIGPRR